MTIKLTFSLIGGLGFCPTKLQLEGASPDAPISVAQESHPPEVIEQIFKAL